jgi:hypothetical protein
MKSAIFRFAAFAICISLRTPVAIAWGEHTITPILERRTEFIRRTAATEYQRRVAAQNAKDFFKQLKPEKKAELRKKKIKAVLIPTPRGLKTPPEVQDVRMRYFLEGEALIDGYAYEFRTPLEAGTIAHADGLDPEYVGL